MMLRTALPSSSGTPFESADFPLSLYPLWPGHLYTGGFPRKTWQKPGDSLNIIVGEMLPKRVSSRDTRNVGPRCYYHCYLTEWNGCVVIMFSGLCFWRKHCSI